MQVFSPSLIPRPSYWGSENKTLSMSLIPCVCCLQRGIIDAAAVGVWCREWGWPPWADQVRSEKIGHSAGDYKGGAPLGEKRHHRLCHQETSSAPHHKRLPQRQTQVEGVEERGRRGDWRRGREEGSHIITGAPCEGFHSCSPKNAQRHSS